MGFPICTIGEQLILRRWACSPQCVTGYTCSLIASEAFAAGMPSSDYNAQAQMQYGARGMAPGQTDNPRADALGRVLIYPTSGRPAGWRRPARRRSSHDLACCPPADPWGRGAV